MKKARFLDAVLNQFVGKLVPAILLSIVFICAPRAEETKVWLTYDDWSIGYFMNDMGVPQAFTRAVQNSDTAVLEFTYNGNLGSPGNYHSIDIYLYGSFGYKDTDRLAFKMLMKAGGLVGTVNGGGVFHFFQEADGAAGAVAGGEFSLAAGALADVEVLQEDGEAFNNSIMDQPKP